MNRDGFIMISNIFDRVNKQLFLSAPLKIIHSLAWVGLAILALPTVVGSYLALKKAVSVWSKNERSDTNAAHQVAGKVLTKRTTEDLLEEFFEELEPLDSTKPALSPEAINRLEKRKLYEAAISQFRSAGRLGTCSAEAYFDYLKSTGHGFYFKTDLLYPIAPKLNDFLEGIKQEIQAADRENVSLVFVPFLLAKNLVHEQHIVVAVVNTAKQQIEYFDPKGNWFYSVFGNLVERNLPQWNIPSQEFLENLSTAAFPNKEKPSIIRNINGPQSLINKVDCGAHALDFIQTRLYTDFRQSDYPNYFETSLSSNAKQLREQLAATLEERRATIE
jgi:hypothetical protein